MSLDFELHWGVRDHSSVDAYPELRGARRAVKALLHLFEKRELEATWAAVGLLMLNGRADAESTSPQARKLYSNHQLSAYQEFPNLGRNPIVDPLHFAPDLIEQIVHTPGQELGTHTFSHYYCLEPGANLEDFSADLNTALNVAQDRFGVRPRSIVFPRNQVHGNYLKVCRDMGLLSYRGVQGGWMHQAGGQHVNEGLSRRGLRLVDSYFPLSKRRAPQVDGGLVNIPASAFLRPYSSKSQLLDPLRIRRINKEMERAARDGGVFHLWWHPHNFGRNLGLNLHVLCQVLDHFGRLRDRYGMESRCMAGVARAVLGDSGTALRSADPMTALRGADPMTALKGADSMTALKGADPMTALKGADPMTALKGADPMTALKGADPMTALKDRTKRR